MNKNQTRVELIRERWKKLQEDKARVLRDEELDDDEPDEEDAELHSSFDMFHFLWHEAAS